MIMSKFSVSFYLTVASASLMGVCSFVLASGSTQVLSGSQEINDPLLSQDKENFKPSLNVPRKGKIDIGEKADHAKKNGPHLESKKTERPEVGKLKLGSLNSQFANIGNVNKKKQNVIKGNIYGPHGMNLLQLAQNLNAFIAIRDCSTFTIEGVIAGGAGKDFHIKYKSSKIPIAGLRGRIPVKNKHSKKLDPAADSDMYINITSKKDLPDTPYATALAETRLNNYRCYLYDKTGNDNFIGDVDDADKIDDYFVYRCDNNGSDYWINSKGRNVTLTDQDMEKIQPVYVLSAKTPISQGDLSKVANSLGMKRIVPINVPDDIHDQINTIAGVTDVLQDKPHGVEDRLTGDVVRLNYSLLSTYKMLNDKKCKVYMSPGALSALKQARSVENSRASNVSYQCCEKANPTQCEWRDSKGQKVIDAKLLESFAAYVPVEIIAEERSIIPDYDTAVVRTIGYDFPKEYDPAGELGFVNQEDRNIFEYLKKATDGMVFHGADADNPVGFLFEMSEESPYTTFAPALPDDETSDAKVHSSKDPVEFINLVNRYRKAGYNVILNPRTGVLLRYDETSQQFMYDSGVMIAGTDKPNEKHWYASEDKNAIVNFGAIETGLKMASSEDQKSLKSFLNNIYSLQKLIAMVSFEPPLQKNDQTGARTSFCSFDSQQACNASNIKTYHFGLIDQVVNNITSGEATKMRQIKNLLPGSNQSEKLQAYITNLLNTVNVYKQKHGVTSADATSKEKK